MLSFPCLHSEFEARFPDELEAAMAYEQNRQAQHIHRFGSLDGFRAAREFPCAGMLRVLAHGPQWEIGCDTCAFLTTVRSPDRDPAGGRPLEEAQW